MNRRGQYSGAIGANTAATGPSPVSAFTAGYGGSGAYQRSTSAVAAAGGGPSTSPATALFQAGAAATSFPSPATVATPQQLESGAGAASPAPATSPHQRTGTIGGVTMNTLCNVMGAGVLALPVAFHEGSVLMGLVLLFLISRMSTAAAHALTIGCDAVGRYSYTECVVLILIPSDSEGEDEDHEGSEEVAPLGPTSVSPSSLTLDPSSPATTALLSSKKSLLRRSTAAEERAKLRRILSLVLECVIVLSSCGTLIVYSRVIGDAVPPVLV